MAEYLCEVWTMQDYEDLPEGSHIHVTEDKGDKYIGMASFLATTFEVTIPKKICTTENPLEKILGKIRNGN